MLFVMRGGKSTVDCGSTGVILSLFCPFLLMNYVFSNNIIDSKGLILKGRHARLASQVADAQNWASLNGLRLFFSTTDSSH